MKNVVFIHTNARQMLGAIVGRHTMKKRSGNADSFDVRFIHTDDYPSLARRHGQLYLREGEKVKWNENDLQSFTPLRFLPPEIMGYRGRAIVTDPDVFAVKDIYSLFELDLQGRAIAARKIRPKDGRPHYWASSVMLLDCEKLTHWQWERRLDELFSFKIDYRDWMSLLLEDQNSILELPEEWNHYDVLNEKTILLHNTGRITQPWKTGLPIDFEFGKKAVAKAPPWGKSPKSWLKAARFRLNPPPQKTPAKVYRSHPDKNQERLFFDNLREVVKEGGVDPAFLTEEIQRSHLRKDAIELLGDI